RWGEEFLGVLQVSAAPPRTFSPVDAELLSLFATQAAIAIRNACLYEEAHRRTERLTVVNHIARAVGTTLQLDDLLETVYREVTSVFEADAFFIALYDERTDELDYRLRVDEGIREPPERRPLGTGLTSLVVSEKKPILIRDFEAEKDRLPEVRLWGTMKLSASWLGVPMLIGERLVGVICVQSYRPHTYGQEEQQLLSTIADQVAVAIENARLYAETERQLKEQSALREAGTVISSALDLEIVLSRMAEQMGRAIDATSAYILRCEPEAKAFTEVAEYISPQACARERVSDLGVTYPYMEEDIEFLEAMQAGRHDVSQLDDPALPEPERAHMQQYGASTVLYIPLLIRGQLIGHAELWESRRRRGFRPEEIALCHGIAQQAAIAIENARLFEEEERRATQLAFINEVGDKAASILDLDKLMQEVTRSIQESFNYYNVSLLLLDEERREVVLQAVAGGFEHIMPGGYRQSLDEGIMGFVARTGQSWLARDISKDPYYVKGFLGEVLTKSELCVPVKLGDKVIGALDLQSIRLNDFDQSDVVAMEAVADRLAIAIQNARLFEREQEQRQLAEALEEAAAAISSTLEPDQVLDRILEQVERVVAGTVFNIMLIEDDAARAVRWRGYESLGGEDLISHLTIPIARYPSLTMMVQSGKPIVVPDTAADPDWIWV
ncbi:MAG: GAF domain-containing protein, partial [Chloroflexi bacterium]|nr:GAF domain-containing protein [Chloroflexota bacterium]